MFFVTGKTEIVSDRHASSSNLFSDIETNIPTELVHEILLYTCEYQHALKLKLVHQDIKDGTICVLRMIRIPQEFCKNRGLTETVSSWWVKPFYKWRKIMYPFYQQCPRYQGACRYEQKRQKIRDSYRLFEKFSTSKYLNESKKEIDFLSKNEWFKSSGEDIDQYLKNSTEENKLLSDIYFHRK